MYIEILAALNPALISDTLIPGPFHAKLAELPRFDSEPVLKSELQLPLRAVQRMMLFEQEVRPSAADVMSMLLKSGWSCEACLSTEVVKGKRLSEDE